MSSLISANICYKDLNEVHFPVEGLDHSGGNIGSIFNAVLPLDSSSSTSMSAGAAAMDFEGSAKEREVKVRESLAASEKMPTESEVFDLMLEDYFKVAIEYSGIDVDVTKAFWKSLIHEAFKAFNLSKVGYPNNINEARFKEIMLASGWKDKIKDPETFNKLFNLALGNANPYRRKIDLVELSFMFIWLGSIDDTVLDAEEAIQLYHRIFFNPRLVLRKAGVQSSGADYLETSFTGITLLTELPKNEGEMRFRLTAGMPKKDKAIRCRNITFDNPSDVDLPNRLYFQKDFEKNQLYIQEGLYFGNEGRKLSKEVIIGKGVHYILRDFYRNPRTPEGIPQAPPAPFPKPTGL